MEAVMTQEQKEIFEGYLRYFKAYASRNWEAMVDSFHPDMTVIGTGIDEIKLNRDTVFEFFSREFIQAPDLVEYTFRTVNVTPIGADTGLVVLISDMIFKTPTEEFHIPDNRTTAVMKKTDEGWKLFHAHWSQPAPGQEEGESIPYKKLQEENLHLEQLVKARTRQLAEQAQKLEKLNQTKDKLFSIISHDLRAPFNAILGLSELMLLTFDKNYANKDYFHHRLSLINQQLNSLYILVDNLLNWAKSQTGEIKVEFSNCSLFSILNNQINTLKQIIDEKGLKIIEEYDKEIAFYSDCEIVSIIVRNFLTNAIKFSYREAEIIVRARIENQKLIISVTDFGIGMGTEVIQQILDENRPNHTTLGTNKEKGSGLGLRLCLQLAKIIRGEITIESTRKTGTTLSLILELEKAKVSPQLG